MVFAPTNTRTFPYTITATSIANTKSTYTKSFANFYLQFSTTYRLNKQITNFQVTFKFS